jgi:hypothetical protein
VIVVVEGISAAGKSTWSRNYSRHIVPETGRLSNIPDRNVDPIRAAHFWAGLNAARWSAALHQESSSGLAVCDTDPLKLHYIWTLWQIGEAPEEHWKRELDAARKLIREKRIGFADLYLVKKIDPEIARRQRDADSTRTRGNFELHIRLQEPLMRWYEAFRAVLPQPVLFELPVTDAMPTSSVSSTFRYAPELFEEIVASLNRV